MSVVHLVDLDLPEPETEQLTCHLDGSERRRAAALRDPRERSRFCAIHGWVRVALGRELGVAPSAVPLVAPTDRKPWIEGTALHFSASRSGGCGAVAVSWSGGLGVDVEEVRDGLDPLRFAARWYTPAERRSVEAAPAELRNRRCLEIWTRKEAYLKATGTGLTVSPASVEVAPAGPRPARIGGWVVHQLAAGAALVAAVALADDGAGRRRRTRPPQLCGLRLDGTPRRLFDRGALDASRGPIRSPEGTLGAQRATGPTDPGPTGSTGETGSTGSTGETWGTSPGFNAATRRSSSPML